ncbi:A/G-specific adenine glycosylase [Pedobacter sp. UYP24]
MSFQTEIITWYLQNKRDLPWRNTRDPYVIWLSEIILQQTRVEQGLPYFIRFLEAFPTVTAFASATEMQILKLWQGLGYYSRGRNMLYTAQQIVDQHKGVFPSRYEELMLLKGVGDYTAAAISSFSADELKPVLDGNVFRVLSRFFGISTPINSTNGKKEFIALAQDLIVGQKPAIYNQAIMEFGALQCKPKSPNCFVCPIQSGCYALTHNLVNALPVKEKKLKKRIRHFNYFVCVIEGQILVHQRTGADIWQEMFDLPLIETESIYQGDFKVFSNQVNNRFGGDVKLTHLEQKKHLLTHQTIYVDFFALDNYIINFNQNADIKWVSLGEFEQLPQPKVIANFIEKYFSNQL